MINTLTYGLYNAAAIMALPQLWWVWSPDLLACLFKIQIGFEWFPLQVCKICALAYSYTVYANYTIAIFGILETIHFAVIINIWVYKSLLSPLKVIRDDTVMIDDIRINSYPLSHLD